jgi:uncharacterized protein YacL
LTLYILFIGICAAAAATHEIIGSIGNIPSFATNLVIGGAAGAILCWISISLWRRIREEIAQDSTTLRLRNSIVVGASAVVMGFLISYALTLILPASPGSAILRGIVILLSLGLGLMIGYTLDMPLLAKCTATSRLPQDRKKNGNVSSKIIDTSVIIDGRIGDLVRTGFIEGEIIIPEFVLAELQNIADSSNSLRRRKGRRGLEILGELMNDEKIAIHVLNRDFPSVKEVDHKLIRLATEEHGALITTDYNLNRVAQVEGVKVLNINELANTVKPRFIPGEEIEIEVIDRGEEIGQGVGYLDDGTMVVIENGRRHIGRTIKATVKSTLQTEAGRMLFVEPCGEAPRWSQ